jgi:hypothetical protein
MKRAKREGKTVSMVRDKLFIDVKLYVLQENNEANEQNRVGNYIEVTPAHNKDRPYKHQRAGSSPTSEDTHL